MFVLVLSASMLASAVRCPEMCVCRFVVPPLYLIAALHNLQIAILFFFAKAKQLPNFGFKFRRHAENRFGVVRHFFKSAISCGHVLTCPRVTEMDRA